MLQRCIDSVVGQSYPNKELLVIDGASTDGTVRILQQQGKEMDYRESAPDRGIYHAWIKALGHVQGEWVCFLGADDYFWSNTTLEQLARHLAAAQPRNQVIYGKIVLVTRDERVIEIRGQPWQLSRAAFLQGVPGSSLPHQGVLRHRSLFQESGEFDESFRIAGDFEVLLRALKDDCPLFVPDVIVAGMGHGSVSTTAQYSMASLREAARARKKNGITDMPLLWYWCGTGHMPRRQFVPIYLV